MGVPIARERRAVKGAGPGIRASGRDTSVRVSLGARISAALVRRAAVKAGSKTVEGSMKHVFGNRPSRQEMLDNSAAQSRKGIPVRRPISGQAKGRK